MAHKRTRTGLMRSVYSSIPLPQSKSRTNPSDGSAPARPENGKISRASRRKESMAQSSAASSAGLFAAAKTKVISLLPAKFSLSDFHLPKIDFSGIHLPKLSVPRLHLPEIHKPQIHLPQWHLPRLHLPAVHFPRIPWDRILLWIGKLFRRLTITAAAAALIFAVMACVSFSVPVSRPEPPIPVKDAVCVWWDGTPVGIVDDAQVLSERYEQWRSEQADKQGMPLAGNSLLSSSPVQVSESYQFCSEDEILTYAQSRTPLNYIGCVLQINGHDVLAMRSHGEIRKVLESVMAAGKKTASEALVQSGLTAEDIAFDNVRFLETLHVEERPVEINELTSQKDAVELLMQESVSSQLLYTVESGDTLQKIAGKFRTTQKALLEANPDLKSADLILEGMQLSLNTQVRPLNLSMTRIHTDSETVPFTRQQIDDPTMLKGQTAVTQKGVDGLHILTVQDIYTNGQVTASTTISDQEKIKMVPEITAVGTKEIVVEKPPEKEPDKKTDNGGNKKDNPGTSNKKDDPGTGNKTSVRFPYPVSGYRISSRFGKRNISVGSSDHKGIDLAVKIGTPVYASADGTVAYAGWATGYGNVVYINHSGGYQTRYAHNSKLVVKAGQKVKKGQLIAYSGDTGVSSGPHVHFEIRKNGVAVNPELYQ